MIIKEQALLALSLLGGKSSYKRLAGFMPPSCSRPSFYALLRRLEKEGLIKRRSEIAAVRSSKTARVSRVRLLPGGAAVLESKFGPRVRRLDKTGFQLNKNFSLIAYFFPSAFASRRQRFQRRLAQLACGKLARGVYISADDILSPMEAFAEEKQDLDHVFLSSIPAPRSGFWKLVSLAWDLPKLARGYQSILDRLAIVRGQPQAEKRQAGLRRIKSDFIKIIAGDPILPPSLLPDWPFERVKIALPEE